MSERTLMPFEVAEQRRARYGRKGNHNCQAHPEMCLPVKAEIRERLLGQYVPPRFQGFTVDNDLALNWMNNPNRTVLYITGEVGTGKSTMAYSIVEELLTRCEINQDCWLPTSDRISVLSLSKYFSAVQSYRMGWDEKVPRIVSNPRSCHLVLLDDLMPYKATDTREAALSDLVDDLYSCGVPIIVTSNFLPEQMNIEMGGRIISRLGENAVMIYLEGPDRRQPDDDPA